PQLAAPSTESPPRRNEPRPGERNPTRRTKPHTANEPVGAAFQPRFFRAARGAEEEEKNRGWKAAPTSLSGVGPAQPADGARPAIARTVSMVSASAAVLSGR